jgi:hypothetical protein
MIYKDKKSKRKVIYDEKIFDKRFYERYTLFLCIYIAFPFTFGTVRLGGIENTSKMAVILGGISSVATGVIRVIKTFPHTQNFDYKF